MGVRLAMGNAGCLQLSSTDVQRDSERNQIWCLPGTCSLVGETDIDRQVQLKANLGFLLGAEGAGSALGLRGFGRPRYIEGKTLVLSQTLQPSFTGPEAFVLLIIRPGSCLSISL